MRYQERIYIQNENSSVRNKDILNVNMSSDLCVFQAPLFNMSGASKLDCACTPFCTCPNGYTTSDCVTCKEISYTSATLNGGGVLTADTKPINSVYGSFGSIFFQNIDGLTYPLNYNGTTLKDNNGSGVSVNIEQTINTTSVWGNPSSSSSDGRLNDCGIWSSSLPTGQWIGFSYCLTIPNSKIYSIGIAADNKVRFKINGEIILNLTTSPADNSTNFKLWHVFPITLTSGFNIIELEGYDNGGPGSMGVEIYSESSDILSGLTTSVQLTNYTVFSSKNKYGDVFELGSVSGYSCPSNYALDSCGINYSCVTISSTAATSGCSANTSTSYIISTATTLPLTFDFTGNTDTFSGTNASFKYEIYKFNSISNSFLIPPIYKSNIIEYSGFSGTNITTQYIPVSGLSLDGDYLVKGYFQSNVCTDYLNRLGKKIDTLTYRTGSKYGLYDSHLDYYFIGVKEAETPLLLVNGSNTQPSNSLFQQVILPPSGSTNIIITNSYSGYFILTLNGLVLSPNLDYIYSGNIVTLSSQTVSDDIISIIYTTTGGNNLIGDNINITSPILSGSTNGEGLNSVYFDITTNKFEIFTTVTPSEGNSIIVMVNGVTLANGIDFYQSITNKKRIILEGNLMVGDLITIAYFPITNTINGLTTNNPTIMWTIATPPQLNNGRFTLELSSGNTFSNFISTGVTDYVIGQTLYSDSFIASGNVGTKIYYRVKNEKNYESICGQIVTTIKYSETIPLTIQNNAINSY